MSTKARILVVDDDRYDNDRYCQVLQSGGYEVLGVSEVEQALAIIEQEYFDVVILDMLLPLRRQGRLDFGGIEVLRRIRANNDTTQVIAITGYGSRELAAEAMAAGALDYITKDLDTDDRLPGSVRVAVTRAQSRGVLKHDTHQKDLAIARPEHLIADSAAMRQLLRRAQRLANIDAPVLIVGEPGVGKELIANVLHINSPYATGPFIVVPCRSLSKNLIELFGNTSRLSSGFCAQAEGGTLVLKGIHDIAFNQQKQLVSLIEQQIYQPQGSKDPISCNFRLIATTTFDLERLVRQGRFWRGLYDALNIATLEVPPLRERRDKDDIMAIAGYILHRYSLASAIAPDAALLLAEYDYASANIRELEDILRHAAAQSQGEVIQWSHLPVSLQQAKRQEFLSVYSEPAQQPISLSIRFVPGDTATLIWESHAGGSARSQLHLPFDEIDIPLLLRALDAVQWPNHPNGGPQFSEEDRVKLLQLNLWDETRVARDIARRVGQLLYQALIVDPSARSTLHSTRNTAIEKGEPLALTLRFASDATTLATLPWEILWDERQPLLLSGTKLSSCVRYLDIPQAVPPPTSIRSQLRLLAVCPQSGIPDDVHWEESKIRNEAFRPMIDANLLQVEELRPARITDLTDRLQDGEAVDILHFYGHGIWKDGVAHLRFDDGMLSANQIATLVGDIPLVVLHACRSGTVGSNNLFSGIAPIISAEGIGAVVAMQFTMSIKAANRFAQILYRNIAKGVSLQVSVAKARQALYTEHPESWYVPVLYIRSRDLSPVLLVKKPVEQ